MTAKANDWCCLADGCEHQGFDDPIQVIHADGSDGLIGSVTLAIGPIGVSLDSESRIALAKQLTVSR